MRQGERRFEDVGTLAKDFTVFIVTTYMDGGEEHENTSFSNFVSGLVHGRSGNGGDCPPVQFYRRSE